MNTGRLDSLLAVAFGAGLAVGNVTAGWAWWTVPAIAAVVVTAEVVARQQITDWLTSAEPKDVE